jgi:hypothetical protein
MTWSPLSAPLLGVELAEDSGVEDVDVAMAAVPDEEVQAVGVADQDPPL